MTASRVQGVIATGIVAWTAAVLAFAPAGRLGLFVSLVVTGVLVIRIFGGPYASPRFNAVVDGFLFTGLAFFSAILLQRVLERLEL